MSLTGTFFNLPVPQKELITDLTALAGGTTGTVVLSGTYDSTNTAFGSGVTNSATVTLPQPAFSQTLSSVLGGSTGDYSITNVINVSGLGAGQTVGNLSIESTVVAPAPAGLILAATALPFVGLLRRRLRRPEATTAA